MRVTHRRFVPGKLGSSLEKVAHGGGSKACQETFGPLGCHDLAAGGEEGVALERGIDLDTGLDDVDGWGA
jgi:hypothetical protein